MKKLMIFVAMLLLMSVFVYAEDCVTPTDNMRITKSTVFCSGTYNLPTGVWIDASNVVLDCNGAVLQGSGPNSEKKGILVGWSGNTVKNCVVTGYSRGIQLWGGNNHNINNNVVLNSIYGIHVVKSSNNILEQNRVQIQNGTGGGIGIFLDHTSGIVANNVVRENEVSGYGCDYLKGSGSIGIEDMSNDGSQIYKNKVHDNTQNILLNSETSDKTMVYQNELRRASGQNGVVVYYITEGQVWDNDFYGQGITISKLPYKTVNTKFCVDGVGNRYHDGATGPNTCPNCVTPTDGMKIVKSTVFCSGTYDLPNGISIDASNVVLDCNNSVIQGAGPGPDITVGIYVGWDNNVVKNCFVTGFGRGIQLWGSNYDSITSNTVQNSIYGIHVAHMSSNNVIEDNFVKLDLVYGDVGIFVDGNSGQVNSNVVRGNEVSLAPTGIEDVAAEGTKIYQNKVHDNSINMDFGSEISNNLQVYQNEIRHALMSPFGLDVRAVTNGKIWDNDLYEQGITFFGGAGSFSDNMEYFEQHNTIFCVGGVGNRYHDGATGPTCIVVLDQDNDGVEDSKDLCPNTPAGESVDANGCSASQLDDDKDGVVNSKDLCPNTPFGEAVNANGCSASQLDDDKDGVKNDKDKCPNTPLGDVVDANGCSISMLDDDKDGVVNGKDKCPNTVLPEKVSLLANHYADVDGDSIFESLVNKKIVDSKYTIKATYGCSCKQILDLKPGTDAGELKYGCTSGTMDVFIKQTGWAKTLFKTAAKK